MMMRCGVRWLRVASGTCQVVGAVVVSVLVPVVVTAAVPGLVAETVVVSLPVVVVRLWL